MKECPACKRCFPDNINNCPDDGDATFYSISGDPLLEGKYQLEKRLGQGGMGVVYKARHTYLKTNHAIKIILPDLVGNDPMLGKRFQQEALAAAAIRHQNTVSVTDFGMAQGTMPFLVMEFVSGSSLHDYLVREKRLSPKRALEIMAGICAGVGAAHRQGIVHRDLKPLNVMFQDGHPFPEAVKVLDFGLAKIKSGELLGSFIQAQTTGLMGSPYYMAPEQWSDEEPDARSDVYSLGVMLYQMLVGDVPFKGASIPSIMKKHLYDLPPSFAEAGLASSPEIEAVIHHATAKHREDRTPSVEALLEEFRQAVLLNEASMSKQIEATGMLTSPNFSTTPSSPNNLNASQISRQVKPLTTKLRITTKPGHAQVFLNDVLAGSSDHNGLLVIDDLQRGVYSLRVLRDGYLASETQINCDSDKKDAVIQLRDSLSTQAGVAGVITSDQSAFSTGQGVSPVDNTMGIPKPGYDSSKQNNIHTSHITDGQAGSLGGQSYPNANLYNNAPNQPQGFKPSVEVIAKPKSSALPIILSILAGVFVLGGIGGGALWYMWPNKSDPIVVQNSPIPQKTQETPGAEKAEMVKIPGGTFMMGRNDGQPQAKPAHEVTVPDFFMDKTEVTNAEYAQFVKEEGYRAPEHWVGGKPLPEQMNLPVVLVNIADIKKFAEWRSKRDGIPYRLPTETEWEYVARNGDKNNLYPWGDTWEDGKAIVKEVSAWSVGSRPDGKNDWGVVDLIGNVWEWTDTEPSIYPGNKDLVLGKDAENNHIIRGGSSASTDPSGKFPVDSTRRQWVKDETRDKLLGFRLVRAGS
jgi:serine/threonine-protein kinase